MIDYLMMMEKRAKASRKRKSRAKLTKTERRAIRIRNLKGGRRPNKAERHYITTGHVRRERLSKAEKAERASMKRARRRSLRERSMPVLYSSRPRKTSLTKRKSKASLHSGARGRYGVRGPKRRSRELRSAEGPSMAKRRRRKLTKAERRVINARNLRGGRKSPKRRVKTVRRRRRMARETPIVAAAERRPRRRKSGRRRAYRGPGAKGLRAARSARRRAKRAHRKHAVRAYSYHSRPKRIRVRAHRSYELATERRRPRRRRRRHHHAAARRRHHTHRRARETYVMENPLSGMELFVGILTGGMGYSTMCFVDRYLATHALTAGTAATATSPAVYTDSPPTTGGASGYQGLYNGTAVIAPMNLTRWAAGVLGPLVPIGLATMVKAPVGRSALQMFGFGGLMHTAGKGLTTLIASLTQNTSIGQRLYDPELRAAMRQVGNSGGAYTGPTLPYSGLDVTLTNTLGRPQMTAGVGSCGCNKNPCGRPNCTVCQAQGPNYPPVVNVPQPPPPAVSSSSSPPVATSGSTSSTSSSPPVVSNPIIYTPIPTGGFAPANNMPQLTGERVPVPARRNVRGLWGHDGGSPGA